MEFKNNFRSALLTSRYYEQRLFKKFVYYVILYFICCHYLW